MEITITFDVRLLNIKWTPQQNYIQNPVESPPRIRETREWKEGMNAVSVARGSVAQQDFLSPLVFF